MQEDPCLQVVQGQLVVRPPSEGTYHLVMKNFPYREYFITVERGERWEFNQNYIKMDSYLLKLMDKKQFLGVDKITLSQKKLSFRVLAHSNETIKAHVFGQYFINERLESTQLASARSNCPHLTEDHVFFPKRENSYYSEGQIPDEIKYVYDRRSKETFIGNTLEKPSALVKRHYARETAQEDEVVEIGRDFAQKQKGAMETAYHSNGNRLLGFCGKQARGARGDSRRADIEQADLFLPMKGFVKGNLRPTPDGMVEIDFEEEGITLDTDFSSFEILIHDKNSFIREQVHVSDFLETSKLENFPKNDLRLPCSKDQGKVYDHERKAYT
jgi:hypothetical protein